MKTIKDLTGTKCPYCQRGQMWPNNSLILKGTVECSNRGCGAIMSQSWEVDEDE